MRLTAVKKDSVVAVFDNATRRWRDATAEDQTIHDATLDLVTHNAEQAGRAQAIRLDNVLEYLAERKARAERNQRREQSRKDREWIHRLHADMDANPDEWLAAEKTGVTESDPDFARAVALEESDAIWKVCRIVTGDASSTDEEIAAAESRCEADLAAWCKRYDYLWPEEKIVAPMVGGVPMMRAQEVIVDLGAPIVQGFNAGQQGIPATDVPSLPDTMHGHPLRDPLNTAIGHIVAAAKRAPAAFRTASVVDVLGVLAAVHADTFKTIVAHIRGCGCAVPEGTLHTAVRRFEMRVQKELRTGAGWRLNLKSGDPDPQNADNVGVLLRFVGAELRFNVWRQRIEIKPADGDWQTFGDAELNHLRAVASAEEYRFRPNKEFLRDMLADIARQTSYDPVLDWIDGCVWDGKPRLVTWLHQACGTPLDPYHQAIGRNVIGGIVKRARHPGTKHDEVMILIGKQGCGKSELTKAVAGRPEWHTDSVAFEGRPQDIIPQLHGKLVIELSELDGMHKREAGHIKRFLSTQTDNYTAKYDAFANDHARRCIFIGTCNLEHPLVDDTGGRRFYPVRIPAGTRINIAWLRENLDQLIGEAAALDAAGETFGIPESVWAAAAVVQETARTVSAVEELVLQWFTKPDTPGGSGYFVLSSDIVAALTMARQNANAKVGATMKRLGYVHDRPYINGVQTRAWIKSHEGSVAGCVQLVPAQNITGGRVEMRVRSGLP